MIKGILLLMFPLAGCATAGPLLPRGEAADDQPAPHRMPEPNSDHVAEPDPDGVPAPEADDYFLPFETGRASFVLQGYFGRVSHEYSYALDFELPRGTTIVAARRGVVTTVREDCPDCSCVWNADCPCCGFANRVEVTHADGTRAIYAHLSPDGVLVQPGQSVETGDPLALSGSTGRSFMPHLHFQVHAASADARAAREGGSAAPATQPTGRLGPSRDGTLEVRFADIPGDGLPRTWRVYKAN